MQRIASGSSVRRAAAFATGLLLVSGLAAGSEEPQVFRGAWIATAEPGRTFKGRWIGQALPGKPNALHGSWTLTGQAGRTALRGTWLAEKGARGWSGTWSAEDQNGRKFSGTWQADLEEAGGASLEDMFQRTLSERLSGSWQTRGRRGHWWLEGSASARAP